MEHAIHCLPTSNAAPRHLDLHHKIHSRHSHRCGVVFDPPPSGAVRFTFLGDFRGLSLNRSGFQNLVNKHFWPQTGPSNDG
jgi:hypothetical protein